MHDDDFGISAVNGAMFDINDDSPGNGFQLANYNPGEIFPEPMSMWQVTKIVVSQREEAIN